MATKSETTPKKSAIITTSPKLRTTSILCQICSVQPSLYCCPRCSFRTCSLSCCQAHKKRENCNGKRNRAAFCSLHEFTDSQLKSDYHFLEDVLNASSGAKRMLKSMGAYHNNQQQHQKEQQKECVTTTTQPLLRSTLDENCFVAEDATANAKRIKTSAGPQHGGGTMGSDDWIGKYHPGLRKLVHQARHRGVNLLLMPNGMEKRKNNSTKYIEKKDAIFWKIEWIFHHPPKDDEGRDDTRNEEHAEARTTTTTTTIVVSHRLSENTILKDELEKHLTSRDYRSRLKSFGTKPRDDILLFVKKVPCSTNDARFYSIDGELSVQRMLKGKSVIEFPTIDVVMKGNDENFPKMIKEVESCKE